MPRTATTSEIPMYFIAQDIETHRYYILNAEEGTIEGIADTEEQ